jgi:hypothetical protein
VAPAELAIPAFAPFAPTATRQQLVSSDNTHTLILFHSRVTGNYEGPSGALLGVRSMGNSPLTSPSTRPRLTVMKAHQDADHLSLDLQSNLSAGPKTPPLVTHQDYMPQIERHEVTNDATTIPLLVTPPPVHWRSARSRRRAIIMESRGTRAEFYRRSSAPHFQARFPVC